MPSRDMLAPWTTSQASVRASAVSSPATCSARWSRPSTRVRGARSPSLRHPGRGPTGRARDYDGGAVAPELRGPGPADHTAATRYPPLAARRTSQRSARSTTAAAARAGRLPRSRSPTHGPLTTSVRESTITAGVGSEPRGWAQPTGRWDSRGALQSAARVAGRGVALMFPMHSPHKGGTHGPVPP
jgi:hypothetical protein